MLTKCYIVEICSDNETMFTYLDDFGFDYWCDACYGRPDCMEIYIDCYPARDCGFGKHNAMVCLTYHFILKLC